MPTGPYLFEFFRPSGPPPVPRAGQGKGRLITKPPLRKKRRKR
jgi:hypothetical protein